MLGLLSISAYERGVADVCLLKAFIDPHMLSCTQKMPPFPKGPSLSCTDEMVSLGSCDTAQGSLEIAPDRLPWRRAGEDWHPETELGQSDAAGGEADPNDDPLVHDEGSVVRLQEIAAAIAEHERQQGSSVDDECAAALGALPASQQRQFAAGFREFADAMM